MLCGCPEKVKSDLNLGLNFKLGDSESVKLTQVIQEIKNLLNKPDENNENLKRELRKANTKIIELEQHLVGQENLENIKNIEIEN
jgi:hypothetical protein